MIIKKSLYITAFYLVNLYTNYLYPMSGPKESGPNIVHSAIDKNEIKNLKEIFTNDDLGELKKFIAKYPNFDFTKKNIFTSYNPITNQEESESILPGHPMAARAYKCLLYLIEQHKIPENFIGTFEKLHPSLKDKIQKELLNFKQGLDKNKISLDSISFEKYLKSDNLQEFKNSIENLFPSDILRYAASFNAKKIIQFIIDSGLYDINKDPATLTWFALQKPQDFNNLVNKLQPSQKAKDIALQLLENDFFGNEMTKGEYDRAKKLLLYIGAEPTIINPISFSKV